MMLLSFPKTIYFNLKYLSFKEAIKLPVLVSYNTLLSGTEGEILLKNPNLFGVKIGFGGVGIFDKQKSRTIWSVNGKVVFEGSANIGHGSKISVNKSGVLTLGDNFVISAESTIVCSNTIKFGLNTLMSWDALFMDTDFHKIYDLQGRVINEDKPIIVGDNVWIGCRCTILKGASIPNNTVIAAGSLVSKSFYKEGTVIGGNPPTLLKENINWGM